MLGVIIALGIVGIISLLLISSLCFKVKVSDTVYFDISYFGIKLFAFDPDNKNSKSKSKNNRSNKEQSKKKISKTLKEFAKGKTRKELIEEVLLLIKELCIKFGKLLKHIRFKRLDFSLVVGSSDAATTAIIYGNMCAVVYSICAALSSAYNFDVKKINVLTDFSSEEMKINLNSNFKIRLIYVIQFIIKSAFSIIKLRMGEVKNGRT